MNALSEKESAYYIVFCYIQCNYFKNITIIVFKAQRTEPYCMLESNPYGPALLSILLEGSYEILHGKLAFKIWLNTQ